MVGCVDADHVYLRNFLLSKQAVKEWMGMDPEVQSSVLHHSDFPFSSVWRTDVSPYVLYAAGFSIMITIVGLICFKKKQDKFILYI